MFIDDFRYFLLITIIICFLASLLSFKTCFELTKCALHQQTSCKRTLNYAEIVFLQTTGDEMAGGQLKLSLILMSACRIKSFRSNELKLSKP